MRQAVRRAGVRVSAAPARGARKGPASCEFGIPFGLISCANETPTTIPFCLAKAGVVSQGQSCKTESRARKGTALAVVPAFSLRCAGGGAWSGIIVCGIANV